MAQDEPIISNRGPRPGWPESRAVVGPTGSTGLQGFSGYSGFAGVPSSSGYSGLSGYSGPSGYSGYSGGPSGYSGYSGISGGPSGFSGYSGSGISGYSGASSASGYSGYSGYSSTSGYSGYSSISGLSGYSGYSGFSGFSGYSAYSGYSGSSIRTSNTISYQWNTSTANADPGSGKISANAAPASAILLHLSATDQNSNSLTNLFTNWNNPPGAIITVYDQGSPLNYAVYDVLSFTNNGSYWDLSVKELYASGSFTNNLAVRVNFDPRSDSPQNSQSRPGNPSGTTSLTLVMMGLAGALTPLVSGNVLIIVSGTISNSLTTDGAKTQLYWNTGSAPTNGQALIGNPVSGAVQFIASANAQKVPFSVNAVITGLTAGTAIWIDLALAAITAGTANVYDISMSAIELP